MRAVIFGTGKWAKLIGNKLNSISYVPIFVGSKYGDYTREELPKDRFKDCVVFIASATDNHFKDLVTAIRLQPSKIFIEKGFSNYAEKRLARYFAKNIDTGILSQYRYSKVFNIIPEIRDRILSIKYNVSFESDVIKEWSYHIMSIDNFIKNKNNSKYNFLYGNNTIDQISNANIMMSSKRLFEINIKLFDIEYIIHLGKDNILFFKEQRIVYENEDCLLEQLNDVLSNYKNSRIERL
ncbi:MAG: hypothetical protein EBU90_15660 [Proteobacteria bacterium]|nr:hypothetical protein [Pseudomonadota bacterium]NBP14475.1 hypothetical protein [bacterium]